MKGGGRSDVGAVGQHCVSGEAIRTESLCFPALVTVPSMGYTIVREPVLPAQPVAVRRQVSKRTAVLRSCTLGHRLAGEESEESSTQQVRTLDLQLGHSAPTGEVCDISFHLFPAGGRLHCHGERGDRSLPGCDGAPDLASAAGLPKVCPSPGSWNQAPQTSLGCSRCKPFTTARYSHAALFLFHLVPESHSQTAAVPTSLHSLMMFLCTGMPGT